MTRQERKEKIQRIADLIWYEFSDLLSYKNYLEEIGCMAEAKKLDTVCGKLYNLSNQLQNKCKKMK